MTGGRSFTFRKVSALAWSKIHKGGRAGIIKVELYEDMAHTEPIGKPRYYFGSVKAPAEDTPESAYADAWEIITHGTEIDPAKIGVDAEAGGHGKIEEAA